MLILGFYHSPKPLKHRPILIFDCYAPRQRGQPAYGDFVLRQKHLCVEPPQIARHLHHTDHSNARSNYPVVDWYYVYVCRRGHIKTLHVQSVGDWKCLVYDRYLQQKVGQGFRYKHSDLIVQNYRSFLYIDLLALHAQKILHHLPY